jgi:hypothetical protein
MDQAHDQDRQRPPAEIPRKRWSHVHGALKRFDETRHETRIGIREPMT